MASMQIDRRRLLLGSLTGTALATPAITTQLRPRAGTGERRAWLRCIAGKL
jgi:hypothetical protein